jgi:SRSO17 transposase
MSSILEHPTAQALLDDATLSPAAVAACRGRLTRFLRRYLPRFYRDEQRQLATVVVEGHLSGLERKTCEPIANQAGRPRKPVQHFVGCGKWDDEAVLAELRDHARETLADPGAVLVVDPSGFPKKGTHSCGVQRQWCGRLGKEENCQVGVFLAYVAPGGCALVDQRLYLPRDWAQDKKRRHACHVPKGVKFQEKWRIALEQLGRCGPALPHGWVAADDEFGRVSAFRARLRARGERYVLDVPCNTLVRDLAEAPPPRRRPGGRQPKPPLRRVDAWAALQPASAWRRLEVRPGEKGPLVVEAVEAPRAQTQDEKGHIGPVERLVVIRSTGAEAKTWYTLSNAAPEVPLAEVVFAHGERHKVEELLQQGNGEVGLDHYEVRSWDGWHHHMTLALLALWFLVLERRRLGEKKTGRDGGADARDLHPSAAAAAATAEGDRGGNQPRAAAYGGGAQLRVAPKDRGVPPAAGHTPAQEGPTQGKRVTVELAAELFHLPGKPAGVRSPRLCCDGLGSPGPVIRRRSSGGIRVRGDLRVIYGSMPD